MHMWPDREWFYSQSSVAARIICDHVPINVILCCKMQLLGINTWFQMQIVCFSYRCIHVCTTVRNGTCRLTLGIHVHHRIAAMEITNYLSISQNFIVILSIIIYQYIFYLYIYHDIIPLLSKENQLSVMALVVNIMPFGRPWHSLYLDIYIVYYNILSLLSNTSILVKFRTFLPMIVKLSNITFYSILKIKHRIGSQNLHANPSISKSQRIFILCCRHRVKPTKRSR